MTKNAFILNFFKLYNVLWTLVLPLLKKNKRLAHGFEKRTRADHLRKADIWLQAASAGESYLAVEILKNLAPDRPVKVLVTTMTTQGRDILLQHLNRTSVSPNVHLTIDWFPFDIPRIMEKAVQVVQPRVMVLLETELWPALIHYLKQHHCRVVILNARLSQKSFTGYKRTRFFWKHFCPDRVCAVSERDAERYQDLFTHTRVTQMHNIKFETMTAAHPVDAVPPDTGPIFTGELPVTILASIRKQEEDQVVQMIKMIRDRYPGQIIAVFPRHMNRISAWQKHLKQLRENYALRSAINRPVTKPGIILWDTFGELKTAYAGASVVFVGGSLKPLGGQNFLEPAVFGIPTITGPFYDDFAWVGKELFRQRVVSLEKDWKSAGQSIIDSLNATIDRTAAAQKAQNYLHACRGGTHTACQTILHCLNTD